MIQIFEGEDSDIMKYSWKTTDIGLVDNIGIQFQKLIRSMNQNKLSTRYRYIEAMRRFILYVGPIYKIKKLTNMKDKHLESYAKKLIGEGKSHKYVKNELAGIRFIHNQMDHTKFSLEDSLKFNNMLGLNRTTDGRIDRAWTERELVEFCDKAIAVGKPEIMELLQVVRATGMRLDEAATLRKQDLVKALKCGKLLLINTKGGVRRTVPLNDSSREIFSEKVKVLRKGEYAFTPIKYIQDRTIYKYEKQVQRFIYNHRSMIQDKDRALTGHNLESYERGALTVHGLRHMYGRERYSDLIKATTIVKAKKQISKELGHGRENITLIYIGNHE